MDIFFTDLPFFYLTYGVESSWLYLKWSYDPHSTRIFFFPSSFTLFFYFNFSIPPMVVDVKSPCIWRSDITWLIHDFKTEITYNLRTKIAYVVSHNKCRKELLNCNVLIQMFFDQLLVAEWLFPINLIYFLIYKMLLQCRVLSCYELITKKALLGFCVIIFFSWVVNKMSIWIELKN